MNDFSQFYQDGGVFMHVVTLFSIISGVLLIRRVGTIRKTFRDPNEQLMRLRRGDVLTPTLICAAVLSGALGTALGWISVFAAVPTVAPEQMHLAAMMGAKIATYTVAWSLLCAVPLTIAHGVLRHFEDRLRVLIEKHA